MSYRLALGNGNGVSWRNGCGTPNVYVAYTHPLCLNYSRYANSVAFYYDDIPYTAPEPDLSVYDICGDIYPQVVVDRVLGMKKSKTTGKGKQQSKTTGKGKKKSKAKGEDKKKPGKKKINRKGEEKQGQRPTSYPEEG